MPFNSIEFAIFLPIVFILYWFVSKKHLGLQNALLLVASYVFYGWWDWRFLSLIIISSGVDYLVGLNLSKTADQKKRKLWLLLSIAVNIGMLGFFKYFNFFAESFADAFTLLGTQIEPTRLNIILPVGISFYTFQTMSYTIDIFRKKLQPTKDLIAFFAFVGFFPQLVAGPIERASNLLPQFFKKRDFDYHQAVNGMRQILWGLFKKMAVADNCAVYVDHIFRNPEAHSGSELVLGAMFFAFQIYGDFSGYSDIAIGTARLFGFNLMRNFAFPYFSRDIAEFWRRWHISLSTWFRDYLYIPLGGSRGSKFNKIRNTFIIFLVSGFWHGANWTFVAWGALHAIYFLPLLLMERNRHHLEIVAAGKYFPSPLDILKIVVTFCLTSFAWIFFRSESIGKAFEFIKGIFSTSILTAPDFIPQESLLFILILVVIEWLGREGQFGIDRVDQKLNKVVRWLLYLLIAVCTLFFAGKEQDFIYFQF